MGSVLTAGAFAELFRNARYSARLWKIEIATTCLESARSFAASWPVTGPRVTSGARSRMVPAADAGCGPTLTAFAAWQG